MAEGHNYTQSELDRIRGLGIALGSLVEARAFGPLAPMGSATPAMGVESNTARSAVANRVGVPVTRSTNPLSPVREFDALGNEITYRTMSPVQAKQFELTGQLPATTETSTVASLEYASGKYTKNGGVTFRLTTNPGTSAQLQEIGVAAGPKTAAELNLPIPGWKQMQVSRLRAGK